MICNFMIFSESVGSGAPYSAKKPLQKTCNGFFADGMEVYYGGVK